MTMDENTRAKYEEKIKTLLAMAKKKKNVLEYQEISDHFADLHLEEEQMDEILDALEKSGIDVLRITDDDDIPDEELLFHIRSAFSGKPVMEAKIQKMLMSEYSRLRRSEQSLLFFITNVGQLTPVERELVRLLLQNYKVGQIAELRVVELVTVKTQIKSLLRKFNCTRTKEIVNLIHELKLEHLFL